MIKPIGPKVMNWLCKRYRVGRNRLTTSLPRSQDRPSLVAPSAPISPRLWWQSTYRASGTRRNERLGRTLRLKVVINRSIPSLIWHVQRRATQFSTAVQKTALIVERIARQMKMSRHSRLRPPPLACHAFLVLLLGMADCDGRAVGAGGGGGDDGATRDSGLHSDIISNWNGNRDGQIWAPTPFDTFSY